MPLLRLAIDPRLRRLSALGPTNESEETVAKTDFESVDEQDAPKHVQAKQCSTHRHAPDLADGLSKVAAIRPPPGERAQEGAL